VKAEPLVARALAISEKALGPDHPAVATSLNGLAALYYDQGAYAKAEPLYTRALAIREKALGPDHPDVAQSLYNLALFCQSQGAYAKAEPLYTRALAIREKVLGRDHPDVAASLNNLAGLYGAMGRVDKAVETQALCNDVRERDLSHNLASGSERRKLLYLHLSATELDFTISLHVSLAPANPLGLRSALEIVLRRKGRALDAMSDAVERLRRHASPEDRTLLDELADARARHAAAALRGPGAEGVAQYRADLEALDERVEALESQIALRSARFRAETAPISLDAVQKAVPAGAALVEFASYRPVDVKAAPGK
jgi:tetratricopeptide (TPR) repeat protein